MKIGSNRLMITSNIHIHHFYHIYATGHWREPLTEHIKALQMGLIEKMDTFAVGIVGSVERRNEVKQYLSEAVDKFTVIAEAETGWEQVTQIPMWEFSKVNEGLILYAHTKGASNPEDVNIRWRRSMTYWNVIKFNECLIHLATHGAVGCHWIQPLINGMPEHTAGNFMFAGTFFWTHCNLMRTWNAPALTHRHEAEGFIGYGWHAANFPVFDFTPYFPNTDEFADGWVYRENYYPQYNKGKSYG